MIAALKQISILFILILLLFPKTSFAQEVVFTDNFNDGNMDGWNVVNGNWFVNNGSLVSNQTGTNLFGRVNSGDTSWDNYRIELDINSIQGIDSGIGFRREGNESYEVNLRFGTGLFNTPEIKFYKVEQGISTILHSTRNIELLNSKVYKIKIEVQDERIKLFIDNILIFDIEDANTTLKKGQISLSTDNGAYGRAFVRFDNITVTKLPSLKPQKTPVIFIPGIGGSELRTKNEVNWSAPDGHGGVFEHIYNPHEKVWVNEGKVILPGHDDYFDVLRLKSDGETQEAPLEITGELYPGAYGKTLEFFADNGFVLNQNFFIFPYDWRKDIADSTVLLDEKIEKIIEESGSDKVDIVAHSMGGLVARNYISDPIKAENVRKLITLGTPHLGSVNSLKAIMHGTCITKSGIPTEPICLGIPNSETKDILQNMTTSYQLMPSQKYYDFYSSLKPFNDIVDIDQDGISGELNYSQTKNLLTNLNHNTSLFTKAEEYHQLDNALNNTNGVETTIITGSGFPTLGQIIEKYLINFAGIKITKKDQIQINGDNTVSIFSSSLEDSSTNKSLKGSAKTYYTNQTHSDLVFEGEAMNLVKNILKNNNNLPDGVFTTPYKLNGKQLSVHSPVEIHAYDILGNHTGRKENGDFEAQIPGSYYDELGDAKFIFLPEVGNYQIKFKALDKGSFDFKIRDYNQDQNTQTILYSDIPLTHTTTGSTEIKEDETTPPEVLIDSDNNNSIDLTFNPTNILDSNLSNDLTSPRTEINLEGKKGDDNWYISDVKVTLSANDLSGISKIEYLLDEGETIKEYTTPFTINKEGITKLKYRSIDKAGNIEDVKKLEIKIDKTAPEAKIQFNLIEQKFEVLADEPGVQILASDDSPLITLKDMAGNETILTLGSQEWRKLDYIELNRISYNGTSITLPVNRFLVFYRTSKTKLTPSIFIQTLAIKNEEVLVATYNPLKRESIVINKEVKNNPKKEIFPGVKVVSLITNKGQLSTQY